MNILVLLESRDGQVRPSSLEALGAGRSLADNSGGGTVTALTTEEVVLDASTLGSAGADHVLSASSATHSAEAATAIAIRVAKEIEANLVLLSSTVRGRDLLGRLGAGLDVGIAADCTGVEVQDNQVHFHRPVYAGKANLTIQIPGNAAASLRPNFFTPAGREHEATLAETATESGASEVQSIAASQGGRPDVAEANRVVSGGRGMGSPENWTLLEAVADALPGAALGASRAVVDSGWRPHSEQVGQTGKTVAPELYFACGISGAIQHLAGMSGSKVIVAINKDADAPIHQHATYSIVGDVAEVLPVLAEELAKIKA